MFDGAYYGRFELLFHNLVLVVLGSSISILSKFVLCHYF